jgi:2-phosphoglycerate kinase
MACVDRARREGTSLVVEGSHLIPSLYSEAVVDLFFVLGAPEPDDHLSRLKGPSHSNRRISKQDLTKISHLDEYYRREAHRLNVPLVVFEDLDSVLSLIAAYGVL